MSREGRRTYETAEMVWVYMSEGGGQQDQFRLRFHPPIVGSALDVCQWDSQPIVQHISVKNERAAPFLLIGSLPPTCLSDPPIRCTVRPKPHSLSLSSSPRCRSYLKPLAAMAPKFVSAFVYSERTLGLILGLARIPMKSKSST